MTTLIGRLNEFTSVLVNPRVEGVRHKKVLIGDDSGFVVSLVPASDSGPHMAKCGVDQYLRRHGDRFLVMEHYEVADMFGRRARPELYLAWSFIGGILENTGRAARLLLQLGNRGRAAAVAPIVTMSVPDAKHRIEHCGLTPMSSAGESLMQTVPASDGSLAFIGARGLALPPGLSFDVVRLVLMFPRGQGAAPVTIRLGIAAENSPFVQTVVVLEREDLLGVLPTG